MASPVKTLERLLLAIGAVLIAFYAGVLAFRAAGSRLAIESFETARESKGQLKGGPPAMVRRWAAKQIAAYRELLGRQFAPPLAGIVGTSRPGEAGNVGIAGHRDGFFRALKEIVVGDTLTLDTGATTDLYVVKGVTIVDKADVSVLAQSNAGQVASP